jgi:hypothetical protein
MKPLHARVSFGLSGQAAAGQHKLAAADQLPLARPLDSDQDWQSAGVRRVIFFSAAYLSADALTKGLMICSSACNQSDAQTNLLPSHV